jgi:hypothetical protein
MEDVINDWQDDLNEEYDDNIIFVKTSKEVHERTWRIDL